MDAILEGESLILAAFGCLVFEFEYRNMKIRFIVYTR